MSTLDAPAHPQVVRPRGLADAVEAVRGTGSMLFRGGGTKLDWGAPPRTVDTVVDTREMAAVLRHDPADGIAVVEAGLPLSGLAELLAPHGQQLAVDDAAAGAGATVGGAVAAAADGPRRLRFGPVRGLVLGVTLVLADGTVARSGGTVIKNVAGYDLMRLVTGSLGTLALIARVALRLHPRPAAAATLAVTADADTATRTVLDLLASSLEPAALTWQDDDEPRLLIAFEGDPDAVEEQCAAASDRLRAAGLDVTRVDESVWSAAASRQRGGDGQTAVRAVALPSELPGVAADLAAAAADAGVTATLTSQAGLGLHDAVVGGATERAHADCVRRWREGVVARGGTVVVRDRPHGVPDPAGVWDPLTVWGGPPAGLDLMRRVKTAFDPTGRCAPGRHVGGL